MQKSRRVFEVPGLNLSGFDRFLIMEWLIGNVHLSVNKCLPVSPMVEIGRVQQNEFAVFRVRLWACHYLILDLKKVVFSQEWELACVKHILIPPPKNFWLQLLYFFSFLDALLKILTMNYFSFPEQSPLLG